MRKGDDAGEWQPLGLRAAITSPRFLISLSDLAARSSGIGTTARFRPASLDTVNFLLADVRGALGPYLNVYLVTQQDWSLASVGLVTTISGLVGLAAQTPIGAAIDATTASAPSWSWRSPCWRRARA
jgi:hypothetical protein